MNLTPAFRIFYSSRVLRHHKRGPDEQKIAREGASPASPLEGFYACRMGFLM
jgi:hypothetical protein